MNMINNRVGLQIESHIAYVTLSRPTKMNALDQAMFGAIATVGEKIKADKSIRAVVLSGAGEHFCSGLDKSNFEQLMSQDVGTLTSALSERTHGIANAVQYAVWVWRELPVPVIAALQGMVLGGGLQIALGADIRVASSQSQFSILELKWGIIPDMGSTQIMRHLIRDDVIRELTYTARMFSAEEAKDFGFITHITPDPLAHASELAQQIAAKNPQAIQAAKRVINRSYYQSPEQGLLDESIEQDAIMGSVNQIEAVKAVVEGRVPIFKD